MLKLSTGCKQSNYLGAYRINPLHTSTLTISYLLTLFSKFFSRFPHGTCMLSDSCQYLGLDKIYCPICTPIPKSTTQWILTKCDIRNNSGVSPSMQPHSNGHNHCGSHWPSINCIQAAYAVDIATSSLFTRRYWGNLTKFLFLCWLICLNSARILVRARRKVGINKSVDLKLGRNQASTVAHKGNWCK